ncbi:hypothetical protein LHP98_06985 [Rhodobacter sp. Har01]|uniref:hypothetical protein n=1 Tax=Rhodobacter sp. Har01 TaxID=2883999 RepID=UPI001D062714|nr:hypothetical protein [Rhodobacter sp. Har01]MCB6177874.1 hypothetical protein [Rhodobacter sp. Har01]
MTHKNITSEIDEIVDIVATANGNLIGRTRLQKTACLLTMAGLSDRFSFIYKHYGPFSQDLADATELATLFSNLSEEQRRTQWGSTYSVFTTCTKATTRIDSPRARMISIANAADPIELELATTAAFLAKQGFNDPWAETASRKPEKIANGRLDRAKCLYKRLLAIDTPKPLPAI